VNPVAKDIATNEIESLNAQVTQNSSGGDGLLVVENPAVPTCFNSMPPPSYDQTVCNKHIIIDKKGFFCLILWSISYNLLSSVRFININRIKVLLPGVEEAMDGEELHRAEMTTGRNKSSTSIVTLTRLCRGFTRLAMLRRRPHWTTTNCSTLTICSQLVWQSKKTCT
jgi:hypothetical protein